MLISFSVENFKSIKEKQTIDMRADIDLGIDKENVIDTPENFPPLLRSVGVYGANASGKSNFFSDAMGFVKDFIPRSFNRAPMSSIPVTPFKLDEKSAGLPSAFEIEFTIDKNKYRYGFFVNSERVEKEYLYVLNIEKELFEATEELLFEREFEGEEYQWKGEFGEEKYTKLFSDDRPKTRDDSLYLSFLFLLKIEKFTPIFKWFSNFEVIKNDEYNFPYSFFKLNNNQKMMHSLLKILRCADIGIEGVFIKKIELEEKDSYQLRLKSIHKNNEGKNIEFDFSEESLGTQTLFNFSVPLVNAITNGGVLVIDEIESSLHPEIVKEIIFLFNDPEKNKKNAQLIFTTHNTHFLQFLRRDQIWFTEKNNEQATELYSLADFDLTENEKEKDEEMREKMYLSGKYGAIPNMIEWEIDEE